MAKYKPYKQGIFKPINREKCLNKTEVVYRSHMEFRLMKMCDKNPSVLEWSSEAVIVPYSNPIKGKLCRYYIDAYIKLQTNSGPKQFLVEIKPERQTKPPVPSKRKKKTTILYENATWAVNERK